MPSCDKGVGERVFDVSVNGVLAFEALDVLALAGECYVGVVQDTQMQATDLGEVTVEFSALSGDALVSSIQVLEGISPTPESTPTTPV